MKVKCLNRNKINGQGAYSGVKINNEYIVLSIEFYNYNSSFSKSIGDNILYRLLDDDGVVIPYPSTIFEVVSDKTSPTWIFCKENDESYSLIPREWARKSFWDDYYNDVEDAIYDFNYVKEKLYYEEIGKSSLRNKKYSIWIEAEEWAVGEWDINNDNTDVIVEFEDGSRWVASFFTYSNINKLVEKNTITGECLDGKYLWSSDMILVDEVSRERIQEVVDYLINKGEFEGEFECAFKRCQD